jgi:hypothetical protein
MKDRNRWLQGSAALLGALAIVPGAWAQAASPAAGHVCVDVRLGTEATGYLDCLNAELRDIVEQQQGRQQVTQMAAQGSLPIAPTQAGLFNQTATAERLGSNFGKSVLPQRPPQPVYPVLPPPRH